ncbi:MAG: hypothetical protein QNJ31_03950 [Candidatus Caenarcaniphilales bacterium]|nr:hypothetical protein [Candidatus Caenarcaniphilales bacterium]
MKIVVGIISNNFVTTDQKTFFRKSDRLGLKMQSQSKVKTNNPEIDIRIIRSSLLKDSLGQQLMQLLVKLALEMQKPGFISNTRVIKHSVERKQSRGVTLALNNEQQELLNLKQEIYNLILQMFDGYPQKESIAFQRLEEFEKQIEGTVSVGNDSTNGTLEERYPIIAELLEIVYYHLEGKSS